MTASAWHPRVMRAALAGLTVIAFLVIVQHLTGGLWRTPFDVPQKSLKARTDGTFSADHKRLRLLLADPVHPRATFLENQTPLPRLTSRSELRRLPADGAGGGWMVDRDEIRFRAPDNTDPRGNGRNYRVVLPATVPAPFVILAFLTPLSTLILTFRLTYGKWPWHTLAMAWRERVRRRATSVGPRLAPLNLAAEIGLSAFLILMLAAPAALTMWRAWRPQSFASHPWLANLTLPPNSRPDRSPLPAFSPANLASGLWQNKTFKSFNEDFTGREALIRIGSESWFRLFRAAAPPDSDLVIMKRDQIIQRGYLGEYCLTRTTPENLTPFVLDLKKFQDLCDQHRLPFTLLLTPGKVAFQPEDMSDAWQSKYKPGARSIELFVPLLQKHGVRFVDGVALTHTRAPQSPAPAFPQGGVHWNDDVAWQSTSAVLDQFRSFSPDLPRPITPLVRLSDEPIGEDDDVLRLLCLAKPWRYPVVNLTVPPVDPAPGAPPRRLMVIGGSFAGRVINQLGSMHAFQDIEWLFYYKMRKLRYQDFDTHNTRVPAEPVDLENEVFNASALLLETNEEVIGTHGTPHLRAFLSDAIPRLAAKPL
ncbi:MAG: hypothetical protein JWL81_1840 [Verrucomicrobiales bacterium]|nr:hypothetical protein [Verrucomicrobiales bacterium]